MDQPSVVEPTLAVVELLRRDGVVEQAAGQCCLQNRIALSYELEQELAVLAKVCSAAVNGIEAYPVEVEVNIGYGDTIIVMIGTK